MWKPAFLKSSHNNSSSNTHISQLYCCYYINMLLLQNGSTALHHACDWGRTEVAKCLLINGANLSATNKVDKLQNKFLH